MNSALLSLSDLTDADIDQLLARGVELAHGASPSEFCRGRVVGLLFLETSLRTRVGFAAAATRLGASFVDVVAQRANATSMAESLVDTMRTLSSYVDVVVARPGTSLLDEALRGAAAAGGAWLINGGDAGPAAEHPTQTIIDLAAMVHGGLAIPDLHIAICGDLRMRAVRSLMQLLARRLPRSLTLVTEARLEDPNGVPHQLRGVTTSGSLTDLRTVDILYVAGMPHECLPLASRERLIVDEVALAQLPSHAIVLSPMPVIDEITDAARIDPRVRMHEQSQHGLFIRMAILERFFNTVHE